LFGPLFPFVYAAICLVLFALMDLLTIRSATGAATVSSLGMLQIWNYFSGGLSYDSLSGPFDFIIRNFWQTAMIYALVFGLARSLAGAKRSALAVSGVTALPHSVAPAPD
jgi:hypothetical protein